MRKRQKPYVLITALVLCFGAVAFMNTPPKPPTSTAPNPNASPDTGKDVAVPNKSSVQQDVAAKMQAHRPKMSRTTMDDEGGPESKDPVVLRPKANTNYKPKPNESQTAGQWYEQDAVKDYSGKTGH